MEIFGVREIKGDPSNSVDSEGLFSTHFADVAPPVSSLIGSLQWCPDSRNLFASCADDGVVNVWDQSAVGAGGKASHGRWAPPQGLLFRHLGHRWVPWGLKTFGPGF